MNNITPDDPTESIVRFRSDMWQVRANLERSRRNRRSQFVTYVLVGAIIKTVQKIRK